MNASQLKSELKKLGYYVDNLWSINDIKDKYKCTDEQAQTILDKALTNEATMEQIWYVIDTEIENADLEPNEE